ncbi:uncharacterized protein GGS25DRAFT_522247 [Hypoxylon fragiforme]|uniref:uncharacterized protein n=1 Tax=Hypoxylon fragiforme TaxID=63214 RepID=UPI0020C5D169|nr:uncharacterized protein GGS25DRAFT_522247 [Hypoxylon fragiforme]KAI2609066.1 hypothetical protein GGS25DRAFT_522247 [Hypoxylon fragiforme]
MKSRDLFLLPRATTTTTTIAAADPPLPPWYPLQPWRITSFSAHNPRSTPYGTNTTSIALTIASPRPAPHASGGGYVAFDSSVATCAVHWKRDPETPQGGCLVALSFTLACRMRVYGQEDMYKLLGGSFTAQVGRNIEGGCAGDDGVGL